MLVADTDIAAGFELDEDEFATAFLPSSLFDLILEMNSNEEISVIFTIYEQSFLLPVMQQLAEEDMDTVVGTPVLAASVANETFDNLSEPVILLLQLNGRVSCIEPR